MRSFISVLGAFLVGTAGIGVAPPALAAPATERADQAQQLNSWMSAAAGWANGFNDVLDRQAALLRELNLGTAKALEFNNDGQRAEGARWAGEWAREQRRILAQMRADLEALPMTPPGPRGPGYDLSGEPIVQQLTAMFVRMPDVTKEQMVLTERLAEKYITSTERAASGDENAALELAMAFFDVNIASLRSEILLMEAYLPLLIQTDSYQQHVSVATIALDRALIKGIELARDDSLGAQIDRKATAVAMREQAAVLRRSSDELTRDIAAGRGRIMRIPGDLGVKLRAVADTYDESARDMLALAEGVDALAAKAEQGATFDSDGFWDVFETVETVIDRFATIDQRRKSLLAQ